MKNTFGPKSLFSVEAMKNKPFVIAVDGSNDMGLEKMNPMTVHHFDETQDVVTQFLDMCLTSGKHTIARVH